jgi:hypothetical protein
LEGDKKEKRDLKQNSRGIYIREEKTTCGKMEKA